jgi:phosphoribosyl-dephospho-CoA transferase
MRLAPWVVVRRGSSDSGAIPVGVRGTDRSQRWAAFCAPADVREILTPPQLLERRLPEWGGREMEALRTLAILKSRWKRAGLAWGPGGSVGFELATGVQAVRPESDLDVIAYVDRPMTAEEAEFLCQSAMDLPSPVDIRVETPLCGFSLREYVRERPAPILLRTHTGAVLGSDPWASRDLE